MNSKKISGQKKQVLSWFLFYPGMLILLLEIAFPPENNLIIFIGFFLAIIGFFVRDDIFNKKIYRKIEIKYKNYFLAGAIAIMATSILFLIYVLYSMNEYEISDYPHFIALFFGAILLYFLLPLEISLFKYYRDT